MQTGGPAFEALFQEGQGILAQKGKLRPGSDRQPSPRV